MRQSSILRTFPRFRFQRAKEARSRPRKDRTLPAWFVQRLVATELGLRDGWYRWSADNRMAAISTRPKSGMTRADVHAILQRIGAERSLAQRLPATTSRPKNEPAIPFASNSRTADSWAPARMRSSTFRSIDTGGSCERGRRSRFDGSDWTLRGGRSANHPDLPRQAPGSAPRELHVCRRGRFRVESSAGPKYGRTHR